MIILVSPSKTMNNSNDSHLFDRRTTIPRFQEVRNSLIKQMQDSLNQLQQDMNVSNKIFDNVRNQLTSSSTVKMVPALFAYTGAFYQALDAKTLPNDALTTASNHLGILSGLYGLLKASDLIEPYRLPIEHTYHIFEGFTSLSSFWQSYLEEELKNETILSLASKEYERMLGKLAYISIDFRKKTAKGIQISSVELKKIRGKMCRYLLCNPISSPNDVKGIILDGYQFDKENSTSTKFLFIKET